MLVVAYPAVFAGCRSRDVEDAGGHVLGAWIALIKAQDATAVVVENERRNRERARERARFAREVPAYRAEARAREATINCSRAIQNLIPVLRELGLVTIFWDVNIGNVGAVFDENGKLLDESYYRRADKFIKELIWMAKTLRYGRENISEE